VTSQKLFPSKARVKMFSIWRNKMEIWHRNISSVCWYCLLIFTPRSALSVSRTQCTLLQPTCKAKWMGDIHFRSSFFSDFIAKFTGCVGLTAVYRLHSAAKFCC